MIVSGSNTVPDDSSIGLAGRIAQPIVDHAAFENEREQSLAGLALRANGAEEHARDEDQES
jgi:hypothetical protein